MFSCQACPPPQNHQLHCCYHQLHCNLQMPPSPGQPSPGDARHIRYLQPWATQRSAGLLSAPCHAALQEGNAVHSTGAGARSAANAQPARAAADVVHKQHISLLPCWASCCCCCCCADTLDLLHIAAGLPHKLLQAGVTCMVKGTAQATKQSSKEPAQQTSAWPSTACADSYGSLAMPLLAPDPPQATRKLHAITTTGAQWDGSACCNSPPFFLFFLQGRATVQRFQR